MVAELPLGMLRHVVMFTWADDVEPGQDERVAAALDTLARTIPEIRSYVHGRDAGLVEGNFGYVVVADFDSPDDFFTYRNHPAHQEFLQQHIVGKVAARAAVQFPVG